MCIRDSFFFGAFGPALGMEDTTTVRVIFLAILTGLQALCNHLGIGLTAKLTDFSGYLIFATALALTIVCLISAPSYEFARLWTFGNYSGEAGGSVWPQVSNGWVFMLGLFTYGTSKWPTMGPWNMGRFWYSVFAILSILAMVIIFVIGIQPPNDWALYITIGFLILTAIVWFGFEARRFQGPPVGDMIVKRQAEIAAAEAALDRK